MKNAFAVKAPMEAKSWRCGNGD